jgi:hypothetical protein
VIASDLTPEDLVRIGRKAVDAYLEGPVVLDHDAALAAAGTAAVAELHVVRREQRETAEAPRLTVEAVVAEPDAETLQDIYMGGGQGR